MMSTMALILFASACSHRMDLSKPSTQDNFGVQMARMNLWREALFRFQRAVQISPDNALAHNNLAVAWEANGDFEKARKEYLEALKLDRSNQYIQKNYSRYVEFLSRNRKRQAKDVKTAAAGGSIPPQPIGAEPVKLPPPTTPPPSDLPPQPRPPAPPGGGR
jgi:Flp pilus assembly protein TadD